MSLITDMTQGGRNWEGFSNDPYLSGVAMANVGSDPEIDQNLYLTFEQSISGMQAAGVQACAKHFCESKYICLQTHLISQQWAMSKSVSVTPKVLILTTGQTTRLFSTIPPLVSIAKSYTAIPMALRRSRQS